MLQRKQRQAIPDLSGKLARAEIVIQHTDPRNRGESRIEVMYNPEDLLLSQRAVVQGEGSNVWFSRTEPVDLEVKLFFDTYETLIDVRVITDKILSLTEPWPAKVGAKVPPTVNFMWGEGGDIFTGIVINVAQKFTMFLPSGVPVRAELTVTFKEVLLDIEDERAQGLDNCRQLWTVKGSDRLDSVAYSALGDRSQWRLIADANGIYDPIGFPGSRWTGATIAIPDTHNETFEPPGASDYA